MHFQVADVHKALLSTARCADMGYECHLGINGWYLEDAATGDNPHQEGRGTLHTRYVDQERFAEQPSSGFVRPV